MTDNKVFKLKVSLLGDGAVGKTSLIKKYVYDEFEDKYLLTLGAKTTLKKIDMVTKESGTKIECNLMIWDIMGQKEFERLHKTFFRGTKGAFVVTDLTRRETLESVDDWITRLFDVTGPIPMVFVINKCDLMDKAEFKKEDLEQIAGKYKSTVFYSSAKTGENVDAFFYRLGQVLCEKALFEDIHDYVEGSQRDMNAPAEEEAEDEEPAAEEEPMVEVQKPSKVTILDDEDEDDEDEDEDEDDDDDLMDEDELEDEEPEEEPQEAIPEVEEVPEEEPEQSAPEVIPQTTPEPAVAAAPAGGSDLVKQLQGNIDGLLKTFEALKQQIQNFEAEKAQFLKEKADFEAQKTAAPEVQPIADDDDDEPVNRSPPPPPERTSSISWE